MSVLRVTAPKPDQRMRMEICRACPHATGPSNKKLFCGKCGCVLAGKTRIQRETCPLGKW